MSELIRREDLENWLRTECYGTDTYDDKEYVIGRLRKELPTIAASQWHRVEEPPKERDDYFAFTSDGEAKVCDYIPSVKQWWDGDYMILNVTHWMPIEPPKEDA